MTNRERNSSTDSSERVGRCAMSTGCFLPGADLYLTAPTEGPGAGASGGVLLLGVELDDELLLDRDLDLLTHRELVDQDPHPVGDDVHPAGNEPLAERLAGHDERSHLQRLLPHVDHVVLRDLERRDVDLLPVDQEVAVGDQLAGVAAGPGEAGAVHHVVEAALEELQQVVTGLAGTPRRLVVVPDELLLEDAVGEAGLLLLAELQQVLRLLRPAAGALAGGGGGAAARPVAADEVDAETARLLGHGAGVTGHVSCLLARLGGSDPAPLGRTAAVVGGGRDVLDRADLEADRTERADRGLTARAGALDEDVDLLHAVLHRPPTGRLGGHLRGERGRLARALEADGARRGPRDHRAGGVGDRDDRVVERALDVPFALGDVLLLLAAHLGLGAGLLATSGRHGGSPGSCCGFGRWSWSADPAPGGSSGGGGPGSCRSRSCGGCRPGPRGGGHPRSCSWPRSRRGAARARRRPAGGPACRGSPRWPREAAGRGYGRSR